MSCVAAWKTDRMTKKTHPRIIDTGKAGLRFIQDQERGEVGGVRGDDNHGEAGPHHAQHTGGETAWRSLTWKLKFVNVLGKSLSKSILTCL